MGRKGTGRKEQAARRRTITLLLSLADLAEAACGRSAPVRWLVVLILGAAEPVARDYFVRRTGVPASALTEILIDPDAADDSLSKAMRLVFVFRALATMLAALPDEPAVLAGPAPRATGMLAALRALIAAPPVERRDSS